MYSGVQKGKLSFKGAGGKKKKKKKRKRKRVSEPVDDDSKALVNAIESPAAIGDGKTAGASSSAADSVAAKKKTRQDDTDGMTKSERQFMRVQQKLLEKQIEKKIKKTHREKIKEFNDHLGSLTEHHDIPRVGPG